MKKSKAVATTLDSIQGSVHLVPLLLLTPTEEARSAEEMGRLHSIGTERARPLSAEIHAIVMVHPLMVVTETVPHPSAVIETVLHPLAATETVLHPLAATETVLHPLAATETVLHPSAATETVLHPSVATETVLHLLDVIEMVLPLTVAIETMVLT